MDNIAINIIMEISRCLKTQQLYDLPGDVMERCRYDVSMELARTSLHTICLFVSRPIVM